MSQSEPKVFGLSGEVCRHVVGLSLDSNKNTGWHQPPLCTTDIWHWTCSFVWSTDFDWILSPMWLRRRPLHLSSSQAESAITKTSTKTFWQGGAFVLLSQLPLCDVVVALISSSLLNALLRRDQQTLIWCSRHFNVNYKTQCPRARKAFTGL